MHYWASVKSFFALCFMCGLLSSAAYADELSVTVKRAELVVKKSMYLLYAEIDYQLTSGAIEALQNGIPLFWDVEIKIEQQRDFLWNKTVAAKKLRYRISYHALLNMYRIRDELDGDMYNFSSLSSALARISSIRGVEVIERKEIDKDKRYFAQIRVEFDREALPLPLRPVAYLNPQWNLSSDWYVWSLTK